MLEMTSVDDFLFVETQGRVQSGPFIGMTLLREQAWTDGALSPMLLGCHEEELHPAIEEEIARLQLLPHPSVVNIGCAEGYYAVGLARRLPQATVHAIDTNDACLAFAHKAAVANGVALVTGETLDTVFASPDLIVCDCEGDEILYLNLDAYPALRSATMIVELHIKETQNTPTILYERFSATHNITCVVEGGRNPNRFEMLLGKPSTVRWAAVGENRPCLMNWFVMRPK